MGSFPSQHLSHSPWNSYIAPHQTALLYSELKISQNQKWNVVPNKLKMTTIFLTALTNYNINYVSSFSLIKL